jgi:hypothetical protein
VATYPKLWLTLPRPTSEESGENRFVTDVVFAGSGGRDERPRTSKRRLLNDRVGDEKQSAEWKGERLVGIVWAPWLKLCGTLVSDWRSLTTHTSLNVDDCSPAKTEGTDTQPASASSITKLFAKFVESSGPTYIHAGSFDTTSIWGATVAENIDKTFNWVTRRYGVQVLRVPRGNRYGTCASGHGCSLILASGISMYSGIQTVIRTLSRLGRRQRSHGKVFA